MKDFLAVVGALLLVACLWLGFATVRSGGVRHVDEGGHTTEVLAFQGWQPASERGKDLDTAPAQSQAQLAARQQPTNPPPPPTNAPAPTAAPPPTEVPQPTARVAAASWDGEASTQFAHTRQSASLDLPPAIGEADPPDWGYAAAPLPISPWDVLGWLMVGLVPLAGLVATGLVIHRQVALTQARVAALTAPQPTQPGSATFEGEQPLPFAAPDDGEFAKGGEVPEQEVPVIRLEDYLAAKQGPQEL